MRGALVLAAARIRDGRQGDRRGEVRRKRGSGHAHGASLLGAVFDGRAVAAFHRTARPLTGCHGSVGRPGRRDGCYSWLRGEPWGRTCGFWRLHRCLHRHRRCGDRLLGDRRRRCRRPNGTEAERSIMMNGRTLVSPTTAARGTSRIAAWMPHAAITERAEPARGPVARCRLLS